MTSNGTQEQNCDDDAEKASLKNSEARSNNYGALQSGSNSEVQYLLESKHENTDKINALNRKGMPWKMYVSRALSAWGDRIWDFGLGIFMNKLAPENLRLVAIQGFVVSLSVIIFGAAIGNWIDRNKRLFAAKLFLSIQNISVAIACAILVVNFVFLKEKVT